MHKDKMIPHDQVKETKEVSQPSRAGKKWVFFVLIIGVSLPLIWLFFPVISQAVIGSPTSLPLPPTETLIPSKTATAQFTATPIPTITNTPLPVSAYQVTDPASLYPPIPGLQLNTYILNDDTAVTPDPGFEFPQWYTSDTISQQLGVLIPEPFHATIGNGSVTWSMDAPVEPGLYEIYALDTLYSSGGALDFSVTLNGAPLSPILGRSHVDYQSSLSNPSQSEDAWHSLGIYMADSIGTFAISTSWDARDDLTIVAVDRVLITRRQDSIRNFIALLPSGNLSFVVDDLQAQVDTNEIWFTHTDAVAWGDQYQVLVNPGVDAKVTWETFDNVPTGTYQVMIWSPRVSGNAEVEYKFLVNGEEAPQALVVDLGSLPGDQWVVLGNWTASSDDSAPVKIALQMSIAGRTVGDVAIDAVAFIKMP
jgi:hypothetical protein